MLPLLPILLIAKLSMAVAAGKGKMSKAQLDVYLKVVTQHRDFKLPELLQHQVNFTSSLLVAIHSALVLLEASTRGFNAATNLMDISSFTPDFVEKDQNGEVTGGIFKESETVIQSVTGVDAEFDRIPTTCKRNYGNNLKVCFDVAKNLPDDFNIEECMKTCLDSAQNMVAHKNYLEGALQLIQHILLAADLRQVKRWLQSGPPDPAVDTADWLEKQLGLDELTQEINILANQLSEDVKLNLSRIKAMVDQDSIFFVEILQRLSFPGDKDDIAEAVTAISANLSSEQQRAWTNMQLALYGAVAWHIFHQAELISERTKLLL